MKTKKTYYRTRGEVLREIAEAIGEVAAILTFLGFGLLFLVISGCNGLENPFSNKPEPVEKSAEEPTKTPAPADQVAVETTIEESAEVVVEAVPNVVTTPAEELPPTLKVYGTLPVEAKKSGVVFTEKKHLVWVELAPFHPHQFTKEWVIKQIAKKTGIEVEEVRRIATDATRDAEKVIAVLEDEGGLNRYWALTVKEEQILRAHIGDIEALERELDKLFVNEYGVSFQTAHEVLLSVHLQENLDDIEKIESGGVYGYSNLVFVFGLGQMLFPEKSVDECLAIFRMLARADKTFLVFYNLPAPQDD